MTSTRFSASRLSPVAVLHGSLAVRVAVGVLALLISVTSGLATSGPLAAAEKEVDFNRDIRPILSNKCYTCHGPDDATLEAELRLDLRESSTEDRGGYQAIAPGSPDDSELLRRVMARDDEQMPPAESGKPLTDSEVKLLRQWIAEGAHYARHWSYEPPIRPTPPTVKNEKLVRNAIDRFVLAPLERRDLTLAREADRRTLIRRLSLDLTGLPPTVEEVEQFVNDTDPKAYDKLVTRLLDSPAYGERWAAMWLDLARYADSAGYANDPPRTIWMYRDWVINAFNRNMPFDQFTIEQIAGDLLPNATDSQRLATAFHRNTLTNSEGGTNDEEFRNVAVVDRVNTTLQVWMGVTIRCAQCHTHKYDPITQEEYFQLFAFFNQTADADRANEEPTLKLFTKQQQHQRAAIEAKIKQLQQQLTPSEAELKQRLAMWEANRGPEPTWAVIKPEQVQTDSGRRLQVRDDGSLVAELAANEAAEDETTGESPETDTYELHFTTKGPITALRIEALPDAMLPQQGPGLSDGGNFVLTEVELSAGPANANDKRQGRYVRVELPGQGKFLHLAEVQVFAGDENVARKGTASQSTTGFNGPAKLANDGNTSGVYTDGSVSHTDSGDPNPWWEVDLGEAKPIDRIVVWNRTDGSVGKRLEGYVVKLLDAERNEVWSSKPGKAPEREATLAISGLTPVRLSSPSATFVQAASGGSSAAGWTPAAAISSDAKNAKTGWAVGGAIGEANAAMFRVAASADLVETRWRLRLKQNYGERHLLGRFRISVTSDKNPQPLLPQPVAAALAVDLKQRTPEQRQSLLDYFRSIDKPSKQLLDQIAAEKKRLEKFKPITTPVMVELPADKRRVTKVQVRGNFMVTGDTVEEGVPAELHSLPEGVERNRLALANWLVARENPLTARVVVNRYWEQLFGIGIVATSEEFGAQGDLPSHPKLLDWLAVELMESGWDLKHLLRTIVTSRVYRQSSQADPALLAEDPENRWLARGPRFRLPAEMIRDQALRAAGLLSDKMLGPSVRPPRPKLGLKAAFGGSTDWETSPGEDRYRRALYTSWRRSIPYPSMATFDAPTRNVCTIRRGRTNTPLQALVTLNDPVYVEAAQALARRAAEASGKTDMTREEQARFAFQQATCRPPQEPEIRAVVDLFEDAYKQMLKQPEQAKQLATVPLGPVSGQVDDERYAELAAWTAVCNVLLNLDEVLVKH